MKDGRTATEQWLSGELTKARDERDTALARMIDAEDKLRQVNEIPDHLFQRLEEFLRIAGLARACPPALALKGEDFISRGARELAVELQKTKGGSK